MKTIVWKWKANILEFIGKPGVLRVLPPVDFLHPKDPSLVGRDGWVAYEEDSGGEDDGKKG